MSKFKKVFRKAAPLAPLVGLVPGLQPLAAAGIAGGVSLAGGGGLKGALGSAAGAYGLRGGGSILGNSIAGPGTSLGGEIGLGKAVQASLGNGILGATAGGAYGGVKGALLGGAIGSVGGYAGAGGFEGTAVGDLIGSPAGTPLKGGLQGPTQGSGIVGAATGGASAGGGLSSLSQYSPALNLASSLQQYGAAGDIEDDLLEQQRRAQGLYEPYLNSEFNPKDLQNDPGYKFQLQQGQEALDKSLAARGQFFSGNALKASQDYAQNFASTAFNQAYSRDLQNRNFNLGAAGRAAGVFDNIGNIKGGAIASRSNALSRAFSGLSGNAGFSGYDIFGNPVF